MYTAVLYNKLLKNYNITQYPFNLIENIKDNIINTKNEIELEYSKDLHIYKEKKNDIMIGKFEKKNNNIYIYYY